ncbi:acyl-CoA thioesterase [Campylobacter blaseri]|uniref:Thioesterase n=1 Tax=Campylobacter blaseri TaxID=2042961 RepID=A0A2P8QZQ7_9BACT|nr:YbgC/FadM family acyl-CoA thioesterase [Campylobacter blaseri]PSM51733.1 thioesterase [Campylobacter blaseri]PSM53524.1 thioesterase [Campylobacter blaseri]QKF86334.1 acyl-CoA thioesterase [Campylobacter blaseri]
MKLRVYYEDTDAAGIVYHANFIKFCERARSELFFSSNIQAFTKNRHFVVTSINAKFIKTAFLGDILEIKSKAKEIKKASIIIEQNIYRIASIEKPLNKPELVFNADIKLAFVLDKKPAKMDKDIIDFLNKIS